MEPGVPMGSFARAALAAGIGDGGDGTVIVETDARRAYGSDGRLVSVGPLEGRAATVSEAIVRDSVLVVGGCEIPLRDLQGDVHTATGHGYAVVADRTGMLAVDLTSCQPVGATPNRPHGTLLLRDGPELSVVSVAAGVEMEHFALPTLDSKGRGASATLDLLPSRDGPARAVRGRVLDGPAARGLTWPAVVAAGATLELEDGTVVVRDGDGVERARTVGTTNDLYLAARDSNGWVFKPELSVDDPVCWPQPRPFGTAVVCGNDELGTVPSWTRVARATEDGAVLVAAEGDSVLAWGVARQELLWRADGAADAVAVGPDWVAARAAGVWTFRDPADGHTLGALEADGSLMVDGVRAPFDPKRVVGSPWTAPVPAPVSPTPPSPFDALDDVHGCTAHLDLTDTLAPWPEAWAAARRRAAYACQNGPEVPDWGVAPHARKDGWAWRLPETVAELIPLGDGSVLVVGRRGFGVLGPDGAPRWVRASPNTYVTYEVTPELVVQRTTGHTVAWDARSGEQRWSRPGYVTRDAGGWWWTTDHRRPAKPFDAARGEIASSTPYGAALGWRCAEGTCVEHARRQDDVVELAGGVRAALEDGRLVISRGAEVLQTRSDVRKLAAAGTDRVIVHDTRSRHWEIWSAAGRVGRLPQAQFAAAWGDARWWVDDGVLLATGAGIVAHKPLPPRRFVVPPPGDVVPPERPMAVGPARSSWERPSIGPSTVAGIRGVAINQEADGLVGLASVPWRRPSGTVDTSLGELVIDGMVVDAATGRDAGPVPEGAERVYVRGGSVVSAHREDAVVVMADGATRRELQVGVPGGVSALIATDRYVYVAVGLWLVAFDGDAVLWKVRLSPRAIRPMVLEMRLAGDLLLVRTLHPMVDFAPVWAFDPHTGDVVDVLDLKAE